jgi:signal transduction histidine kinase
MSPPGPAPTPVILYVDDERTNRVVFEHALAKEFTIKTAPDGTTALEMLDREPVAVLVTDIRMPGIDGLELLQIAKARHPGTTRMVVTAYSDIDPILRAINEGLVVRYIIKPWERDELVQVLHWAIEMWTFSRDKVEIHRRILETERLAMLGGLLALYVHDLRSAVMMVHSGLDELRGLVDELPELRGAIAQAPIEDNVRTRLLLPMGEAEAVFADAKEGANVVSGLLQWLADFMKPGTQRGDTPMVEPLPIIHRTIAMYQKLIGPARATITYQGPDPLPPLRISPHELTQVLMNVVSNASQAIVARGVPQLQVMVVARHLGDMLELAVTDQGPGMPPEVLERVGTPWFTTRAGGTGLGLANCQRLVGTAGGRLQIESEVGVGTTVRIVLPVAA